MLDVADALVANEKLISAENEADVAAAQLAGYEKPLVARLVLKPGKVWVLSFNELIVFVCIIFGSFLLYYLLISSKSSDSLTWLFIFI